MTETAFLMPAFRPIGEVSQGSARRATILAVAVATTLCACGGGGSGGGNPAAAPVAGTDAAASPGPVTSAVPTTSASVQTISLAQSMVYPVDDAQSLLVAGKDAMLLLALTSTNPAEAKPVGSVQVLDAAGKELHNIALNPPEGSLAASVETNPSFASMYSAVIPGGSIAKGMQLKISLAGGQFSRTLVPNVGSSNAIQVLGVPIQIVASTGVVPPGIDTNLQQRAPVSVSYSVRSVAYVSAVTPLPADEAAWMVAMPKILGELADLHTKDGASSRAYYLGVLPKTTDGLVGLGYIRGTAAIVAQFYGTVQAGLHEIGHNFGLSHAPCGNVDEPDPNYPYANATLGGGARSRYIWGVQYNSGNYLRSVFVNPHDIHFHDTMSYCANNNNYSDYNYRLIQSKLTSADALPSAVAASITRTDASSAVPATQELLLVAGRLSDGKIALRPLKRFEGTLKEPETGTYLLRLTTAAGVVEKSFGMQQIDHAAGADFSFSMPDPGTVQRIQILRDGQLLLDQSAAPRKAEATSLSGKSIAAAVVQQLVTAVERNGELVLTWDPQNYPYLSVTHIGDQSTTLALDLTSGSARLPLAGLPAGGSFEFILSDGLNSTRVLQSR